MLTGVRKSETKKSWRVFVTHSHSFTDLIWLCYINTCRLLWTFLEPPDYCHLLVWSFCTPTCTVCANWVCVYVGPCGDGVFYDVFLKNHKLTFLMNSSSKSEYAYISLSSHLKAVAWYISSVSLSVRSTCQIDRSVSVCGNSFSRGTSPTDGVCLWQIEPKETLVESDTDNKTCSLMLSTTSSLWL